MIIEKKLEHQIEFLEETADNLNILEAVLLEVKDSTQIAIHKINAALTAAYSIRNGASVMGFRILSDLGRRLEDVFRVLQVHGDSLAIDTNLFNLLLSGVDWLRQIVKLYSEGYAVDEQWLSTFCYPVFEEIHTLLDYPIRKEIKVEFDNFAETLTKKQELKEISLIRNFQPVNNLRNHSFNMQIERLQNLTRHLSNQVKNIDRANRDLHLACTKLAQYQTQNNEKYGTLSQNVMETIVKIQEIATNIQLTLQDTDQVNNLLHKTAQHVQQSLTQVQMRPLSDLKEHFSRVLDEMNIEYGRNVQLKVEGANTLIESGVLAALKEPLINLLRNAFEHGIEDSTTRRACGKPEQGLIEIKATHHGNHTVITVRDDGRGIRLEQIPSCAIATGLEPSLLAQATDEEIVSLMYELGLSTLDQPDHGVEIDVVRNKLKLIGGDIKVDSTPRIGTTFTLSVPFTVY
jgi:chemotaxis protein histidine kinase CheA